MSKTKEAVSMWPYTPDSAETLGFLASPPAELGHITGDILHSYGGNYYKEEVKKNGSC